jgi:tRNA(fMet)-specific endonuclease VapC
MLKYLLDTNIVIYVMKRKPLEVLKVFNKNANRMAISTITLAELMYGAEKSQQVESNLNNLRTL